MTSCSGSWRTIYIKKVNKCISHNVKLIIYICYIWNIYEIIIAANLINAIITCCIMNYCIHFGQIPRIQFNKLLQNCPYDASSVAVGKFPTSETWSGWRGTAYLPFWNFLIPPRGRQAPVLCNITSEHIPPPYVRHSIVSIREILFKCRITC